MAAKAIRSWAAGIGFLAMVCGIGLQSVPAAMTVGGCLILAAAVIGEMRAK